MTWPSGTPIRRQILDALKARLQEVVAGQTYVGTVNTVTFKRGLRQVLVAGRDVSRRDLYPNAVIVPGETVYSDNTVGHIEAVSRFTVTITSNGYQTALVDEVLDLIEDVRLAIFADHTLGDIAQESRVLSDIPYALEATDPLWGADIELEVIFHQVREDPSTKG